MSNVQAGQKRAAIADARPPDTCKRMTGPTVGGLQKELQAERERQERLQESVEQLRLELQMMGRLLAAAREQLIASGVTAAEPSLMVRAPPAPMATGQRMGRSKSDAKLLQRLQEDLAESKGQARLLAQQLDQHQQKMLVVASTKHELVGIVGEMSEYMSHG